MHAITGISGQIGGVIGRILLDARQPVRAVLRDGYKGKAARRAFVQRDPDFQRWPSKHRIRNILLEKQSSSGHAGLTDMSVRNSDMQRRLLRRSDFAAHPIGVICPRGGRILTQKTMVYEK